MTLEETMRELERLGSQQTRKTYLRHGAPEPLSGVNFGALTTLKKRVGTDPALARALWASGHTEARLLATMVVDAPALSWAELETWAKSLDWHTLTDVFVTNVALRSPHARRALGWTRSTSEWVGRAGWQLLASLLVKTTVLTGEDAEDLAPWLARIEQELPTAKNRVREAMNSALIALGSSGGALQKAALQTAKHLGRVEVDHGDTACETPDATQYIRKMQARKAAATKPATKAAATKAATTKPATTKAGTKAVAKKPAAKKPAATKAVAKKPAATKAVAKKAVATKVAEKKPAAKKAGTNRPAPARTRPRA
ncbi:DNA alkylation repair protein [Corallococcus llansteffanensis]|uniref:DNA alkylation repair protein n=1 Tax=Corallococcus llansteffanensis TaxID=2316731 RepID=A0A3A8N1Y0_9BACT|nr:DNA alkylation repair protein [Corallococcus llansteffanensis]RKH38488.1 DNA alkylation repair protein [Corallococcus llansteffanensis]